MDPPSNLLSQVQAILVDLLHWLPQAVLFLPKEGGGRTGAGAPGQQVSSFLAAVYSEAAVQTTRPGVETSGSADPAACRRSKITGVCVFNGF